MSVEKLVDFVEGGSRGCLWDILVPHFCGDCESDEKDKCEKCSAGHAIGQLEDQIASSALKHMKDLAKEWVKNSVSV